MYETLDFLESSAYIKSFRNHTVLSKDTINRILEETDFPKDKQKYLYDVRSMIFINLLGFNLKRYDGKNIAFTELERYIHFHFGSPREEKNKIGFVLLKDFDPMLSQNKGSRYVHWEYLKTSVSIHNMVGDYLWVKSVSKSSGESSSSSSNSNCVEPEVLKKEEKVNAKPAPKRPK